MRRNLYLSFQEGSKYFRHSVSKICYKAKVSLGRNLERLGKIQMKVLRISKLKRRNVSNGSY